MCHNQFLHISQKVKVMQLNVVFSTNVIIYTRSSRPTDVLWPCHTLLGSPACLRKYLAVLKLLTKYVFADPYANNTNLLYQI